MSDADKEKEFRARFEAEQAPQETEEERAFRERFQQDVAEMQDRIVNPVFGIAGGALIAQPAGRLVKTFTEGAAKAPEAGPRVGIDPRAPGQKYAAKTGYGAGEGETVREVVEEFKERRAPVGGGKISKDITKDKPLSIEAYKALRDKEAIEAALREKQKPFLQRFAERNPTIGGLAGKTGAGAVNVLQKGAPPFFGRGIAGGMAGHQATDAYNRAIQGDVPGAAISGAGSAGAIASMVPNTKTRVLGGLTSVLAEIINRNRNPGIIEPKADVRGAIEDVGNALFGPREETPVPAYAEGGNVPKSKKDVLKSAVRGGLSALKPVDLTKYEGKRLFATPADRTAVDLERGLRGGPMFPAINKDAAWAMDSKHAASRLLNAIEREGGLSDAVVAPMLMASGAHKSNRDIAKMALQRFQENYNKGLFGEPRLQEIQKSVSGIKGLSDFPSLLDPKVADLLENMTFKQRGELVSKLGSKPKTAQALDLEGLLRETTEPSIVGAELGAVGPSLFKLSGERSINPALHGSYSHILHGAAEGTIPTIPRQFVFRDLEAKAMKELGRPLSDYNYRTSVGIPSQLIDEKLLRSWDELGYLKPKTGGVNNPE